MGCVLLQRVEKTEPFSPFLCVCSTDTPHVHLQDIHKRTPHDTCGRKFTYCREKYTVHKRSSDCFLPARERAHHSTPPLSTRRRWSSYNSRPAKIAKQKHTHTQLESKAIYHWKGVFFGSYKLMENWYKMRIYAFHLQLAPVAMVQRVSSVFLSVIETSLFLSFSLFLSLRSTIFAHLTWPLQSHTYTHTHIGKST